MKPVKLTTFIWWPPADFEQISVEPAKSYIVWIYDHLRNFSTFICWMPVYVSHAKWKGVLFIPAYIFTTPKWSKKSIIYNKPTRCNSGSIVFINNYKYAESSFGTHLCKLTICLCWPLFQERSVVNLDRFHCICYFWVTSYCTWCRARVYDVCRIRWFSVGKYRYSYS